MNDATTVTDEQIRAAILCAPAWRYLDELKAHVSAQVGASVGQLGLRVYTINREVEREREIERKKSLGFFIATPEWLAANEGRMVESLVGTGMMGDTIKVGRIMKMNDGTGGFWFRPKGNKTNGYYPHWVREIER